MVRILCISIWVVLLAAAPVLLSAEAEVDFTPPATLEEGWYARIETSMGRILVRLLPDQTPQAVAYFAALAAGELEWMDPVTGESYKQPYYDGTRVDYAKAGMNFEIGRLSGAGTVGPLLYVPLEPLGPVNFYKGARLGFGHTPLGRVSATIFFITVSSQPWLNGEHPCFGEVVSGDDVAFNIAQVKTFSNGRPLEDVTIKKIDVFKIGDPPPLQEPRPYYPTHAEPTPVK
jgi:peptidyl-prolyl cis-trans isomerase A (cyclophilin A)